MLGDREVLDTMVVADEAVSPVLAFPVAETTAQSKYNAIHKVEMFSMFSKKYKPEMPLSEQPTQSHLISTLFPCFTHWLNYFTVHFRLNFPQA